MKSTPLKLITIVLGLSAGGGAVAAQDESAEPAFSYSYIEGGYLRRTNGLDAPLIDGGVQTDVKAGAGNGFFVNGSFEVEKGVYLFGSYEREEADYAISGTLNGDQLAGDFDVTYQTGRFGIGYYKALNANMDIYGQVGLSYGEFKAGTGTVTRASNNTQLPIDLSDESQNAVSGNFELGFRSRVASDLELDGAVFWQGAQRLKNADADSLQIASDLGASVAARFNVTSVFSIGAEYQRSKLSRLMIVARARF